MGYYPPPTTPAVRSSVSFCDSYLTSPLQFGGDYTSGCSFICKQACTVTGVKFRTAVATNPHTVRLRLWLSGAAQVIGAGAAQFIDKACAGAGLYSVVFDTAFTVAAADCWKELCVSMYHVTEAVNKLCYQDIGAAGLRAFMGFSPGDFLGDAAYVPAGYPRQMRLAADSDPTGSSYDNVWATPIEPILTCP